MANPRFQITGPSLTTEEAETLFMYHLQQAACMFEILPDGYKLPKERFDGFTEKAAQGFLEAMEDAYGQPPEGDDGC